MLLLVSSPFFPLPLSYIADNKAVKPLPLLCMTRAIKDSNLCVQRHACGSYESQCESKRVFTLVARVRLHACDY